jgi:hypothetical protein
VGVWPHRALSCDFSCAAIQTDGRGVSPALQRPRRPRDACSDGEVANRNGRDFGWEMSSRGRFATPADFPRRDCSPYSHVHVRRESLGFVHRPRAIFCRPVPNPLRFATLCIAGGRTGYGEARGGWPASVPVMLQLDAVASDSVVLRSVCSGAGRALELCLGGERWLFTAWLFTAPTSASAAASCSTTRRSSDGSGALTSGTPRVAFTCRRRIELPVRLDRW